MRIFDIFKKPVTKPLPVYPTIKTGEIPPASAILFYGGNRLTELAGNRLYKHPYKPPAFHAAFYIEDGLILNVGKFKTIETIESELRSTRRVDVIIYKGLSVDTVEALKKSAYLDLDKPKAGIQLPTYAITDYMRFGLRWFKPSKKDFCSENVVEIYAKYGIRISDQESYNSAPWDLAEFAEANLDLCELRTLYVGADFK